MSTSGSRLRKVRDGVVGLCGPAVFSLSVSILSLDSLLPDFILLSLSTLAVELSFWANALDGPAFNAGVFEPESAEGGLSVHIFSLSLSDSSPLMLMLLTDLCR